MASFNAVQFIGRLGKDPDFTMTPQGKAVVKFSLAVDQGKDKEAMWLNVIAWEKLAETVEKYASKGMEVFVSGRLQMRSYEDKQGVKRQAIDVTAQTVQLLGKREQAQATSKRATGEDFDPFGDGNDLP